jgi:3D (Asp-Asp-Asp) domain-containing protein
MMSVTAYCATGSRDADGTWPQVGYAATLDRSIPFGTHLLVPGYGEVVVHDRIGHGSDLDLYMGDTGCAARADAWGRHYLHVEWLD